MTQVHFKGSWGQIDKNLPSIESAVDHALTPDPYSSDDKGSSLKTAMIGRLVDRLHANGLLNDKDLEIVLGSTEYEVL